MAPRQCGGEQGGGGNPTLNTADGRVGRVDDTGGGVGGGVSQRLSQTAVVVAPRQKEATKVLDIPARMGLHTFVCRHWLADICLRTPACGHLPADLSPKAEPQTRMRARTGPQVYVCRQAPAGVISTNSTINSTIIFDPHTLLPLYIPMIVLPQVSVLNF
jgi:hypothetical protein